MSLRRKPVPRFSNAGARRGEFTELRPLPERLLAKRTTYKRPHKLSLKANKAYGAARRTGQTVRQILWEKETEAHFQARVVRYAHTCGFKLIYHTHDSRRSPAGFPDLVLVNEASARLLFVELKSRRGVTTKWQDRWLAGLGKIRSVECYVWRPEQWEELKAILRGGQQKAARA